MRRLFIAVLVLASCSKSQTVVPKSDITEVAGLPAHTSKIVPDSAQLGDYYIWSKGAYELGEGKGKSNLAHVGIRIENASNRPITLNTGSCQVFVFAAKGIAPQKVSLSASKKISVPRGGKHEEELIFQLADSLSPKVITSFVFHCELGTSAGPSSMEATFVRKAGARPTAPPVWIYDPFGYRWNRVRVKEAGSQ